MQLGMLGLGRMGVVPAAVVEPVVKNLAEHMQSGDIWWFATETHAGSSMTSTFGVS